MGLGMPAFAATTLNIGELEILGTQSASVPVDFRSDTPVAALQMDVLFNPAAYSSTAALSGTQASDFRVDSRLVSPGSLRVVVGAPSNAALQTGVAFRVPLAPLAATGQFSEYFPVVLANFKISDDSGKTVAHRIAPRVRIKNFTSGQQVSGQNGQGRVTLAVEAGATDATVARVDYFVGETKVGSSETAPFHFEWVAPGSGPFTLRAVALDSAGLETASRSIPIVVTRVGTRQVKGVYSGLIQSDPFDYDASGYLTITTQLTGAFSAKLTHQGKDYTQTGKFGTDGTATLQFVRKAPLKPLRIQAQQYATELIDQIVGQVTDGTLSSGVAQGHTFVADFTADRGMWDAKTKPAPQAGVYTIVLPSTEYAAAAKAPQGDSVGGVTVAPSGVITAQLSLADGTKVSRSGSLSKDGVWPLYAPLYAQTGVLIGNIQFENKPGESDFAGETHWFTPPNAKAVNFKGGFELALEAVGSRYTPPRSLERFLNLSNVAGNARFEASGGMLTSPLERLVTVTAQNTITPLQADSTALAVKITPTTGMISGTFIPPGQTKPVTYSGAAFQKQNTAAGWFVSGSLSGRVALEPNEAFSTPQSSAPQGVMGSLPTVTIKTPADKGTISSPGEIVVTGIVTSKKPIESVHFQTLFEGTVSSVSKATGTSAWSAALQPAPKAGGLYTVFVKAKDSTGAESNIVSRTFFYAVPTKLEVTVSGPGSVTAGFLGSTERDIGKTYTITAKPSPGRKFLSWSGGFTGTSPTISFKMREGLVLTARFE